MYESDAQATIEAMLDLSPSLDLAHPFLKGLVGQCDTQLSPARPAWQFAAKPLDEAVGVQIGRASIWTRTAGSVNKPGNYYSGGTYDPADGVQFQDAGDNKETKEEKLAAAKERLEKLETDPTEEGAVYKESSCHGTIETNGEYGKGWHWRTEGGENVVQDETANKTKEPNEKKRVRRSWNLQYELSFVLYATTKVENEDPDKWFYLRLTCTVAGSYVFGDQKVDGELERTDQVAKDFKTNTINENNKKKKEERKPWAHGWDDAESVQEKTYTKYARLPCVNKENAEVSFRFVQSELMLSRKWDEEEGKFVPSNDRMMIYDCGVSTASNGKGWQKAKGDPGNGHKIRSYSK